MIFLVDCAGEGPEEGILLGAVDEWPRPLNTTGVEGGIDKLTSLKINIVFYL